MSWARYDDMFSMNKKVAWLRGKGLYGLAAIGLHVLINTWSRHEGAGGRIPDYVIEQMAGRYARKLGKLLHDSEMLEDAVDGVSQLHDYDEYGERGQPEKPATVRKADLSEKRAAAGRIGGSKRKANPQANGEANRKQTASPEPEPAPCLEALQQQQPRERPAELAAAAAEAFALIVDIREHQQWSRISDHVGWRRKMTRNVPVEYDEPVWSALTAHPGASSSDVAMACGFTDIDVARARQGVR